MTSWVLYCHLCDAEFTHSQISDNRSSILDPFTGAEIKPEFPIGGESLVCPNCKGTSVYQRYQLMYRASAKGAN